MSALVDYAVTSQWNSGFVFEVFVTNAGTQPINDFQVGFDLPGDITQVWNGQVADHTGNAYVITDDDDANDIAPGETVRFKAQVASDSAQMPTRFTVNGQPAIVESPEVTEPDAAQGTFIDQETVVSPGITAAELETLIDNAPDNATIRLAAGDFVFDDAITITRSDVSLVGAGSDRTSITFTNRALENNSDHGIYVAGTGTLAAGRLRADADEHDATLSLESGHRLAVGDTVRVWQDNDAEYFAEIGNDSWQGSSTSPLRTSMAKVTAVDGNTVTLDRGVHFDFDGGQAKLQRIDTLENVTLEGFTVEYQLGTPDDGSFSNTLSNLKDYHAVEFDGTVDSRMADIQVINGPSVAFEFARTLDTRADSLTAQGAFNKGSGGNGYAYELYESYDGTFTNLEDSGMRHSVLFASWRSSVGNDVHVASTDRDINFHGGQDHGNTVQVDQSIRDPATDKMSTTLWINQGGESFGAPTDPTANDTTFDYVVGSRRNDVVEGSDQGAYLDGALGHDNLIGGTDDDILRGGLGNDLLNGGEGTDIAFMAQAFSDYDATALPDGGVFLDGRGDDDVLVDIEQAVFADGTRLDIASRTVTRGDAPRTPTPEEILADDETVFAAPEGEPVDQGPEESPAEADDGNATQGDDISATVEFEGVSRWASGYVMAIELTNTSDTPITDPQVRFDLPAEITQFYGATLRAQDGDTYTVDYTGSDTLDPGSTMRFSFKAYAPESHVPDALSLNGTELEVAPAQDTDFAPPEETPADEPADEPVDPAPEEAPAETDDGNATQGDDISATVAFEGVSRWASGYVMAIELTNTSDTPITDPQVRFDLPAEITQFYGATLRAQDGDTYTVDYTGSDTLDPGSTMRFSFKAYAPESHVPDSLSLNGSDLEVDPSRLYAGRDAEPELSYQTSVTSNVMSTWSTGYTAEVFVENTSNVAIANPTLSFDLPGDIDTVWNGVVQQDGDRYTVSDDNANVLQPGDVWRFSYRNYDTSQALPANTEVVAEPQPPQVEATSVTSNIISSWSSGYTTEVLVENTSAMAIANPTVSFDLPADIDTLWNGVMERDGNRYTVADDDDVNLVLQPGEVWRFSYRVYDTDQALPGEVFVEGQAEPTKVDPAEAKSPVDANGNPVTGEAGDILTGTEGNDTLNGLRGDDYITGAGGDDRLVGGQGDDMLTGGLGADTFVYLSTFDSTPLTSDTILDFNRLEGDQIDLSAIDANLNVDGQQNFTWLGSGGFTGNGGEVRTSGNTLQADVNGDGVTDLEIDVLGVNTLTSSDMSMHG